MEILNVKELLWNIWRKVKTMSAGSGLMVVLVWCAALGWWGVLYPQFTLVDGTYEIVREAEICGLDTAEDRTDNRTDNRKDSIDIYREILNADRSQIRIKSRVLENWKAFKKAGSEKNESGD